MACRRLVEIVAAAAYSGAIVCRFSGNSEYSVGGWVGDLMWDSGVPQVGARLWSMTGLAGETHLLCFPLALLVTQLLEGRTRRTSLAYLFLIVFMGVVGTANGMPHPLTLADFTIVVAAGGCSLLALDPPRHWFCRLLALGGMALGVGPHSGLFG
jgi:hypothetical protein